MVHRIPAAAVASTKTGLRDGASGVAAVLATNSAASGATARAAPAGRVNRALHLRADSPRPLLVCPALHAGLAPLDAPLALQLRERRPLLLGVFLATGLCVGPGQGEMHLGAVRGQPRRGLQLARPPLDLTPLDQRAAQRVVRGEEAGGQRHRPL